tara:strand:- start:4536 stop:4856 length:321 start_codon:yes stop_codon:yes gene_type:complete
MAKQFMLCINNPTTIGSSMFLVTNTTPAYNEFSCFFYHALQDQYLALSLLVAVAQRCLALKDFLLAGMFFLILILGSPKRTNLTFLPDFARTADFLDLPGVFFGLL